jgi:hypothetical protein
LSEVHRPNSREFKGLPEKTAIWQRDELLLILKSTDRCLPLEDVVRFVGVLEDILPSDRIIKFPGVLSISRQLEQMVKSELLEKIGTCYRITSKGVRLADEAELSIENDEDLGSVWQTLRGALGSLPSSKLLWDSHLFSALKQLGLRQ